MAPLPVVLGSPRASSRPLPPAPSSSTNSNTGKRRTPIGDGPLVAVCPDESSSSGLAAHLAIHYYDETTTTSAASNGAGRDGKTDGAGADSLAAATTVTVTTYAELNVEVSPLSEPFASKARTRTVRVRLFSAITPSDDHDDGRTDAADGGAAGERAAVEADGGGRATATTRKRRRYKFGDASPSAAFSGDGRYLACLIPHPVPVAPPSDVNDDGEEDDVGSAVGGENGSVTNASVAEDEKAPSLSSLIVFTLKRLHKPAGAATRRPVPPPSWAAAHPPIPAPSIDGDGDGGSSSDVGHPHVIPSEPRFVSYPSASPNLPRLDRIASVCNASSSPAFTSLGGKGGTGAATAGGVSVLLAGCDDGTLLAIGYRRARVAGVLYRPPSSSTSSRRVAASSAAASATPPASDGSIFRGTDGAADDSLASASPGAGSRLHDSPLVARGGGGGFDRKRPPTMPRTVRVVQAEQHNWRRRRRRPRERVGPRAAVHMSHLSSAVLHGPAAAGGPSPSGAGRLAVVRRDGSVAIYRSLFVPASAPPPPPSSAGGSGAPPPPSPSPHTPSPHPFVALSPRVVVPASAKQRKGKVPLPSPRAGVPRQGSDRSLLAHHESDGSLASGGIDSSLAFPPSPVVRTPNPAATTAGQQRTPLTLVGKTPLGALGEAAASAAAGGAGGALPEDFPAPPPLTSDSVGGVPPPPFPAPRPTQQPPSSQQPPTQPPPKLPPAHPQRGGAQGHGHGGLMLRIERLGELSSTSSTEEPPPRCARSAWIDCQTLAVLANPVADNGNDDDDDDDGGGGGDDESLVGGGGLCTPGNDGASSSPASTRNWAPTDVAAQVWRVRDSGGVGAAARADLALLSTLRLTPESLAESAHGTFPCRRIRGGSGGVGKSAFGVDDENDSTSNREDDYADPPRASYGAALHLTAASADAGGFAGCLAVSGAVSIVRSSPPSTMGDFRTSSRFAAPRPVESSVSDSSGGATPGLIRSSPRNVQSCRVNRGRNGGGNRTVDVKPFVCVWEWRTNVRGLTLAGSANDDSSTGGDNGMRDGYGPVGNACSHLRFAPGGGQRALIHTHGPMGRTGRDPRCLRKESYELASLSPPSVAPPPSVSPSSSSSFHLEEASPLLLSAASLHFPRLSPPSSGASSDSTLRWEEARLPRGYLVSCGAPLVAAAGRRLGRSAAVAGRRGLCVLDLARTQPGASADDDGDDLKGGCDNGPMRRPARPTPCAEGFHCPTGDDDWSDWSSVPSGMRSARPKWRVFQSESVERSVQVLAMAWWERSPLAVGEETIEDGGGNGVASEWAVGRERRSEDVLIAVVQYCGAKERGDQLYLVSWSRRRLGMGEHQLFEDADDANDDERRGVALPRGMRPTSLSVLPEPTSQSERAILLVSSSSSAWGHHHQGSSGPAVDGSSADDDGGGGGCITYMAYRLHATEDVVRMGGEYDYHGYGDAAYRPAETRRRRVLSRLCSTGRIVPHRPGGGGRTAWEGSVGNGGKYDGSPDAAAAAPACFGAASAFVAGGSFRFDLRESDEGFDIHEYVATLGVIRSHGDGLDAVCVTPSGPYFGGQAVTAAAVPSHRSGGGGSLKDAVKYWLSGVRRSGGGAGGNAFEWTVALNDGVVLCWSVPFVDESAPVVRVNAPELRIITSLGSDDTPADDAGAFASIASISLQRPSHIPVVMLYPPTENDEIPPILAGGGEPWRCPLLGRVCPIGDTSLVNGASTNEHEIALGPLSSSSSGCCLYAGQTSKRVRRRHDEMGLGQSPNMDRLSIQVYGVSDCVVAPPAFATNLFESFLLAASPLALPTALSIEDQGNSEGSPLHIVVRDECKDAQCYARYLLNAKQNDDAIITALRVVILRTVDILSALRKKSQKNAGRLNSRVVHADTYAKSVLFEVISAARDVFSPLQFSSLFLGIGRQLEPHHFDNLFPLPASTPMQSTVAGSASEAPHEQPIRGLETVEDLFHASVEAGSISIASSALPMFLSQRRSRKNCTELLKHCLVAVEASFVRCESNELDISTDERVFIQQLYRFGLKLEDSAGEEFDGSVSSESIGNASSDEASNPTDGDSEPSSDSDDSISEYDSSESSGSDGDEDDNSVGASDDTQERNCASRNEALQVTPKPSMRKSLGAVTPSFGISRFVSMVTPILFNTPRKKEDLDEKAISEAASDFISSVFRESEHEVVSNLFDSEGAEELPVGNIASSLAPDGSDDSTVSTASITAQNIEQSKMERSMAGVVGRYLALFLNLSNSNPWQKAGLLAQLLLGESRLFQSTSSLESRNANRLVQSCSADDVNDFSNFLCQRSDDQDRTTTDEVTGEGRIVSFLVGQILDCCHQIEPESASLVFDLVLSLLLRYDLCSDVQKLAMPLIVIGLVVGHSSERIDELVGHDWNKTSVGRCYKSVRDNAAQSV